MYWMNVSTVGGSAALIGNISDEQLKLLAPLFNELGAAIEFGQMGSSEILGGCLATVVTNEGSEKVFLPRDDALLSRH